MKASSHALYDKRGIPIMRGDTVKVFHFTAALRRENRYMYKFVVGIKRRGDSKPPLMKLSHLNVAGEFFWQLMNGRTLTDYEIVQGYAGVPSGSDFRDRARKRRNRR